MSNPQGTLIHRPFRRVGIVNRGEAAVRFLRAARAWSRRRREPLEVVALYTTPDRDALFVREADAAVALGDALVQGPGGLRSAYLDIPRIVGLLKEAGCDAVWPGWGFVSERPDFADACAEAGIVFIGPSGESMRLLGDKIAGKRVADDNGVPVTAWSRGPVADAADAVAHANRIGYPVLLKAAAGGGGRGIRIVREESEVAPAFTSASNEARSAFGDPTLLVEAFAPEARHVEVQVIADRHGRVHAVGTRDCSMQRRHQKVLEEAPAPGLGALEQQLKEAAVTVAQASGYVNAGTAEFLVLPDLSGFFFLEMNTRLQVEHPVTETVTGLDMVGMQIDVARGDALPEQLPEGRGHAIEARLNAEDADAGFRPSAGRLHRFELATGPGVRVDSGFTGGDVVPSEFDSMLAKVIATGTTREEALARLEEALARSTVAIEGGASNRSFLLELLGTDAFRAGPVTTRWLDRYLTERAVGRGRAHLDGALIAAAIGEYGRARDEETADLMKQAHRGLPPAVARAEARTFRFSVEGASVALEVLATGADAYRISCEESSLDVLFHPTGAGTGLLTLHGRQLPVVQVATATALHVEVDSVAHRLERASDGRVVAPVPAAVTEVCVKEGAMVQQGDRLLTLEVMKMEVAVFAPVAGRVSRLMVEQASRVTAGQALVLLESVAEGAEERAAAPSFNPITGAADTQLSDTQLVGMLLGYDHSDKALMAAARTIRAGQRPVGRALLSRLVDAYVSHEQLFDTAPGADGVAPVDQLAQYVRRRAAAGAGLADGFKAQLSAALAWHQAELASPGPRLDSALFRMLQAHGSLEWRDRLMGAALTAALRDEGADLEKAAGDALRDRLEDFATLVGRRDRSLAEAAYAAIYILCDRSRERAEAEQLAASAAAALEQRMAPDCGQVHAKALDGELDALPHGALLSLVRPELPATWRAHLLQLLVQRLYPDAAGVVAGKPFETGGRRVAALFASAPTLLKDLARQLSGTGDGALELDVFLSTPEDAWLTALESEGSQWLSELPAHVQRLSLNWGSVALGRLSRTFRRDASGAFAEDAFLRDFHPARIEATELARYADFDLERVAGPGEVFLAIARAKGDRTDERLLCIVESERIDPERDPATGALRRVPSFERVYMTALQAMRDAQQYLAREPKPFWNRLVIFVRPVLTLSRSEIMSITRRLAPATAGLGLERMTLRARVQDASMAQGRPVQLDWTNPTGHGASVTTAAPDYAPVSPLKADERREVEARRKGLFYPYELIRALSRDDDAGPFPRGTFVELELGQDGETLVPASRPHGQNTANLVVGLVTNHFGPFADGLRRVLIVGDPTRGMGALAEPECRRIMAALELADRERLSVEWVAVSSGARIAMDSGTENLDWTARVLARIIRFTQGGGTINIIVDGINVGAQSYWNAEATMLMHCRGTLIMTPGGSMLLTGKRALEYAGSVAAEDNAGIGGYERIMGPNGEAQYFAPDLTSAYRLLLRHLALTAVAPGETGTRRLPSSDPADRDITLAPYGDGAEGYKTVGEIFDEASNPGRKRAFAIRPVMRAVLDQDVEPLERWAGWQGAESAVVWEGALGGSPVCCIGIESKPVPRRGEAPSDGPDHWTSGTLFPLSSKKVARAINAASGVRPVVVLANLSGFDGSPDSLRHLQLEYGAEIGRAVVNFRGPLVFCVVSRYHGGAYVVFSQALNSSLESLALRGSFASVIGGGPAAAVVFPGLVRKRAEADEQVVAARKALEGARGATRAAASAEYERLLKEAQGRTQAAVAKEFDTVHSVERAYKVGSLSAVTDSNTLRPYLISRIQPDAATGGTSKAS